MIVRTNQIPAKEYLEFDGSTILDENANSHTEQIKEKHNNINPIIGKIKSSIMSLPSIYFYYYILLIFHRS